MGRREKGKIRRISEREGDVERMESRLEEKVGLASVAAWEKEYKQ